MRGEGQGQGGVTLVGYWVSLVVVALGVTLVGCWVSLVVVALLRLGSAAG